MKIRNLSDRLLYVPNRKIGSCLFDGQPYPSKEVVELIGLKGVEFIQNHFQEMLEHRKEMFGNSKIEFYGFDSYQRFFDLKERVFLNVTEIINDSTNTSKDYTISIGFASDALKKKSNIGYYRVVKGGEAYQKKI